MIEKSLPFADTVILREFLSIHITLTLEGFLTKILDPSVIFSEQLESPNLDVCRQSYGQKTITAQS